LSFSDSSFTWNRSGTERFIWPDLCVPCHDSQQIDGFDWLEFRGNSSPWIIGRLKPGITTAEASADLACVASKQAEEYPGDGSNLQFIASKPRLLGNMLSGPAKGFLADVMAMAILVLIAACANLGALFSSRMTDRAKELPFA
jgi:hypothetical protein